MQKKNCDHGTYDEGTFGEDAKTFLLGLRATGRIWPSAARRAPRKIEFYGGWRCGKKGMVKQWV
jgi:hypothetical protein